MPPLFHPRLRRLRRTIACALGSVLWAVLLAGAMAAPALATDAAWQKPLADDFDGPGFAPGGGLFYKKNYEQGAGRVTFETGPGAYSGKGYLKLSVHPLCPPSRKNCSERAEIWQKTSNRVPFDKGIWDGFAVKFGDPIPQDDHRYLIAQWKREIGPTAQGDFSPFLALRMDRGRLFVTVETNYHAAVSVGPKGKPAQCPAGQTPVWLRPKTDQMRALIVADPGWTPKDGPEFNACTDRIKVTLHGNPLPRPSASHWVDYVIYSRPGAKGAGHIEIFANGLWIATVRGDIGANNPGLGRNQYFKFGPYRAANKGVWTMYYDDFRRSTQCSAVLKDAAACAKVAQ